MTNTLTMHLELIGSEANIDAPKGLDLVYFPLNSNYQFPLEKRDCVYLKRSLVGICGKESIKTSQEISEVFMLLPSHTGSPRGLVQLRDACLAKGYIPYTIKSNLSIIPVFCDENNQKYRIKLENIN